MPGGGQRSSLRFAVTDHYRHQQVRIIESGPESVRNAVAQLSSLVDGTWSLRRAVAADAPRKGEFLEEFKHSLLVLTLVRIDLGVSSLQIDWCQHTRCTVARASQKDGI